MSRMNDPGLFSNDPASFRVDINNYLNVKYQLYVSTINGIALSRPQEYFNYEANVLNYIKSQAVKNIYEVLFAAMKDGRQPNGNPIVGNMIAGSPNISEMKINEVCIAIAKSMNDQLEEVVALICPPMVNKVGLERAAASGNASGISLITGNTPPAFSG